MRVYVLHLAGPSQLTRAFDLVLSAPEVESCMVESDHHRIRFLAAPKEGELLVERIYQAGGLLWCSQHQLSI